MDFKTYIAMIALACLTLACKKNQTEDDVISQTYVHKYGYAVSKEEWQDKQYPGQVISSLRGGVTITATYEDGVLNGPYTLTYPHSQVIEKYILYTQGAPVKEITYDRAGMPIQEVVQLTNERHSITTWYADGVPKSIEEYQGSELLTGKYFTQEHDIEAQVEQGNGSRVLRDKEGVLICRDIIQEGFLAQRDSFYPNGSPESCATYIKDQLHGIRRTFSQQGEPLAVEEWASGHLHGLSSYYKNGSKELEASYLYGKKNGLETHFMDGKTITHQIAWSLGQKHGPETFFLPGGQKTLWNYEGKEVSRFRFQELSNLDAMVFPTE